MKIETTQRRTSISRTICKTKRKAQILKDCAASSGGSISSHPVITSKTKIIDQIIMSRISAIKSVVFIATVALVLLLASIISIECHIKRTQYHEQGLHGPKSYKFGYTSGDHKNPQERHEVSDGHGHVKGWYSYVDANGKYQVIHYEAHPKYGFKVHNYKSKAYNNGKRHYGS